MSQEEITKLKEEFFKEIRALEKKLNVQIAVKLKEITEKNDSFIQKVELLSKNNKILNDLISSKNLDSHKINELENFRKKAENMILSHEIRINSSIKDIGNIKYTIAKEISDNLNVPGYIGPSCKIKTIANYIAININDMEKVKNDNESNKKDNKEIRRKIEDMIKTLLNLVDKSNEKSIEYVNKKMKSLEESIHQKLEEINEKIFSFRTVLLTQDKINDFKKKILDEVNENNYDKNEIDKMIKNVVNNFELNLENFKNNNNNEINKIVKTRIDKIEVEIKEINKILRDNKNKFLKISQFQNKILKDALSMKNSLNNNKNTMKNSDLEGNNTNNPLDINFHTSRNIFSSSKFANKNKKIFNQKDNSEEEKISKPKIVQSFEKYKTFESSEDIKAKSSKKLIIKNLKKDIDKVKISEPDDNNNINKIINKTENSNINKIKNNNNDEFDINNKLNNDKINININQISNLNISSNNEENKSNIFNDIINKNDTSYNNFYILDDDIKNSEINENLYEIQNSQNIKEKEKDKDKKVTFKVRTEEKNEIQLNLGSSPKIENKRNVINSSLKKNSKKDKNKMPSNILTYGINSHQIVSITPIEQSNKKEQGNSIIQVFQETNSSLKNISNNNNINSISKTYKNNGGYSLHKLASIGAELNDKFGEGYPTLHYSGISGNKNSEWVKPLKNRTLFQSFDDNFRKRNRESGNRDKSVKIGSAFGRTCYSLYDKRAEGVQNLINKKINNDNRKYRHNSGDIILKLSPVAKIKIFD